MSHSIDSTLPPAPRCTSHSCEAWRCESLHYFTVLVPYVERGATEWHPTTNVGPFAVLSRGAFKTEVEAIDWARKNLNGNPYSVRAIGGEVSL